MKTDAIKSKKELSAITQSICNAVNAAPNINPDHLLYIVQEEEERGAVYIGICYKLPNDKE